MYTVTFSKRKYHVSSTDTVTKLDKIVTCSYFNVTQNQLAHLFRLLSYPKLCDYNGGH